MKTNASTMATLLAMGIASAPQAQDRSIALDVDDLDLTRRDVAASVYSRIESNARLLCRDSAAPWDVSRSATWKRCVSAAVDEAVRRANVPALTDEHLSRQPPAGLAGLRH